MDFTKTTRSPIMLTEENKRFSMDRTKESRGYIKLETDGDKGLVVVTVDNVRFFPRGEYVYKLIFAGTRKERRHYHMIGDISLSAEGTGEGSFRINLRDLNGDGMALSDFSTAIVAAMSTINCRESLHPVLKGSLVSPKASANIKPVTPKDYSPFYNQFVLANCDKISNDQDSFDDILPFGHDITAAKWKKITNISLFPMISPGSSPALKKYAHFLFGCNDSHYFLGVPGRFFPEEQPDDGRSGFVFWQPILGMKNEADNTSVPIEERRKNIYGYWIAAINRYNGHIEEIPLIDR